MKIAVLKSGAIGDVLMTTPFLRALRKTFPDSEITYIVGEWSKPVIEENPNIDRIISFDQNMIFSGFLPSILKLFRLSRKLKKENFDICFVLDKSYLANLFTLSLGVSQRIGFSRKWEGFPLTKSVEYNQLKHEIDYYIDLLSYFTKEKFDRKMDLFLSKKDRNFAKTIKKKIGVKKLIGISVNTGNPGRGIENREWSKYKYRILENMIREHEWKIVWIGLSKNSKKRKDYDLTGKTTLKKAGAVIEICDAFVTVDSGLMHVASAVNTPVISIFGPTDPRRKAPLNENSKYFWKGSKCEKCELYGRYCKNHPATTEIQPEDIIKQLEKIL